MYRYTLAQGKGCSSVTIDDLVDPKFDKWGEASQAMLKSWRSLLRCELATCVCFVRAYTCVCVCLCVCMCMCVCV
jgi:hypothetical protein